MTNDGSIRNWDGAGAWDDSFSVRRFRLCCLTFRPVRSRPLSRRYVFQKSEVTVVELVNELPAPELGALAVAPDRPMAAGFQFVDYRSRHIGLADLSPGA